MVFVYIKGLLKEYEADIRDLCFAFFSLEKIIFLFDETKSIEEIKEEIINKNKKFINKNNQNEIQNKDIIIKDFYNDDFSENRFETKGKIKRALYDYLSNMRKKKLLWGTLTGIRPVTIVTGLLEGDNINGPKIKDIIEKNNNKIENDKLIYDYLNKEYYISKEKGYELIEIAHKELELLKDEKLIDYKNRYSVYIGVPFCKSTCLYCSFTSFNIDKMKDYVEKYLRALDKELSLANEKIKEKNKVNKLNKINPQSLYIGGGTPTSLSEKDFEKLLNIIDKYIDKDNLIEYTVEAGRPDTITKEKLLLMKKYGVTRISINPQSFNQKTLDLIGRKHTVYDVIEKYNLARDLSFNNINMDIILGLPNEHINDVKHTLDEIKKLNPDSLTVHSLALKRAARLNIELKDWTSGYYLAGLGVNSGNEYEKREIDDMFTLSKEYAQSMDMEPYYLYRQKNMAGNLENVGYAKKGKECIYNIMMMEERQSVYSFGTGTTKKIFYEKDGKRIESIEGYKSVIDYLNKMLTST